jgi:AmmeMemoRadiSam system protein B
MEAVRKPAVAGRFYPGEPAILQRDLGAYLDPPRARSRALGCVVPHAGYMYSGHVAGAVYAALDLPRRFVILCPNHTGMGEPLAIMSAGRWLTPLGEAHIDTPLSLALRQQFSPLHEDTFAHLAEHALEVQLPFLQAQLDAFTFVPICVGVGTFDMLGRLGDAIAAVIKAQPDPVLVIASSDMNHYESDSITRKKDHKAIARMLELNPQALYETVRDERISMCGFGPAVAMLTAARALGATHAELVKYATSGDISGDRESVVGYAGLLVS